MLETFRQTAYVYIHLNDSIGRHAIAKFWFKKHGLIISHG